LDPVTHVLSAALWTEPWLASADGDGRPPIWRARAAVALGTLLPDADGVVGWVSLSLYTKYHRVVTHSVVGIPVVIALAALVARHWPERWLLPSLRPAARSGVGPPRWLPLLALAAIGAAWHLVGDAVTGWGWQPLWPLWRGDVGLNAVNSLELPLCLWTIGAWAVQHRVLQRRQRRAGWWIAALWLALAAVYTVLRARLFGVPFA